MSEENQEPSEKKEEPKLPSKSHGKSELSDLNTLLSAFPDEAAPILEKLPDDERKIMVRAMFKMSVKRSWEGPLPDPETLRGYNDCLRAALKRFLI